MPDILSGMIWVQTVCKGYQQTTLAGNELTVILVSFTQKCVLWIYSLVWSLVNVQWEPASLLKKYTKLSLIIAEINALSWSPHCLNLLDAILSQVLYPLLCLLPLNAKSDKMMARLVVAYMHPLYPCRALWCLLHKPWAWFCVYTCLINRWKLV